MDKKKFKAKAKNGDMVEYDVVCTVDIDSKSYLCYTDNTKDENGEYKIYISGYRDENESVELYPIEDDAEWKKVVDSLNGKI